MAERKRPLESDDGQGALFGGDEFAPARPWDRPADAPPFDARVEHGGVADPQARVEHDAPSAGEPPSEPAASASTDMPSHRKLAAGEPPLGSHPSTPTEAPSPGELVAGDPPLGSHPSTPTEVPSHQELVAGEELSALERATDAASGAHSPRAPLAGPTLDDVMSRVWEGLVTGLPAACPICHGEVLPSLQGPPHGRCGSCGTTID